MLRKLAITAFAARPTRDSGKRRPASKTEHPRPTAWLADEAVAGEACFAGSFALSVEPRPRAPTPIATPIAIAAEAAPAIVPKQSAQELLQSSASAHLDASRVAATIAHVYKRNRFNKTPINAVRCSRLRLPRLRREEAGTRAATVGDHGAASKFPTIPVAKDRKKTRRSWE